MELLKRVWSLTLFIVVVCLLASCESDLTPIGDTQYVDQDLFRVVPLENYLVVAETPPSVGVENAVVFMNFIRREAIVGAVAEPLRRVAVTQTPGGLNSEHYELSPASISRIEQAMLKADSMVLDEYDFGVHFDGCRKRGMNLPKEIELRERIIDRVSGKTILEGSSAMAVTALEMPVCSD